jgi:hypothetical protein
MFYNLEDEISKSELDAKLRRWRDEAETEHATMFDEWNEGDNYFENDQVPPGFSEEHRDHLVDANDPTKPTPTGKQYVVVNKVRETHESVLGDFVQARRWVRVTGASPKDKRFGRLIGVALDQVFRKANFWDEVMMPAIDCAIRRGIHWIKIKHNPYVDLPLGRIEIQEVSCRDVLIDPNIKKQFMSDSAYRIHRVRYKVDDANRVYEDLLQGKTFAADRSYQTPYQSDHGRTYNFCTVYEFQYVEKETRFFFGDPSGGIEELDKTRFDAMSSYPATAPYCFKKVEDAHYVALWNESIGAFFNSDNEYGTWTIIPIINIKSEGRPYPLGDTKYYKNLQDLFNVLISVILDNAKKGNRPWLSVDPQSFSLYAEQIEQAISQPGTKVIPATDFKATYPREINQALVMLLQQTEKYMYDIQAKHGPSRGELPTQQIAEKTITNLIAQDRQSHGRKDVCIRWGMTEAARLIYQVMRLKYTEEHWALLTDAKPGDPEYVPINTMVTEGEYKALLMQLLDINPEEFTTPQELAQINKYVTAYQKQFQKENEVRKVPFTAIRIQDKEYDQAQVDEMVKKSGLSEEEFINLYSPEEVPHTIYVINDITRNADLDIIFDIDFNYERDRQFRINQAFALFDRGTITPERLMKDIEYAEAATAAKEGAEWNQLCNLGKAVTENPELYQQVMVALQGNGQGKKQPVPA